MKGEYSAERCAADEWAGSKRGDTFQNVTRKENIVVFVNASAARAAGRRHVSKRSPLVTNLLITLPVRTYL